ncbi:MAG: hypothetical protein HOW97_12260 [Catenulispora sp.]|nr:hypothetical protein [Catenulispora sp.]
MHVRKETAGTAGEHVWDQDGAVVEVPDELGLHLLEIPGGGFAAAPAPDEAEPPARAPRKRTTVKE